ncbi:O-antigen ligase family protein [Cupriavidus pinatubonensis]|uniref:O-antigen ligase family protein n=1 Tax=Cupriavidus pinatubonensis TaxID=248026 RepID=UPI00361EFFCC
MLEKRNLFRGLVTVLLLSYPVIALFVHNAGNAILFFLLVLSVTAIIIRLQPNGIEFRELLKAYWPLHLAMASACLAIFINQLWTGGFVIKDYDRALRLAIFPFIFWILFFVPLRHIKLLQWSFLAAAVIAMVKAYVFTKGGDVRDGNIGFISIIAYSDIALLVGVLCVVSFGWNEEKRKPILLAKILACLAGLYTSVLTATRGSWLAIPLLLVFLLFFSGIEVRRKWLWVATTSAMMCLMLTLNPNAASRFLGTRSDLVAYSHGEGKSTPTGHRLQLWGAALKLIAKEPVFGIGRENYDTSIQEMARKKEITPELTRFAHSHNEILFSTVISGVFGLFSALALYLVPGYFFARELGNTAPGIQTAARMGCVLVIGFFSFGLTDLMFFWPVLGGYYSIMIGAFLVFIARSKGSSLST